MNSVPDDFARTIIELYDDSGNPGWPSTQRASSENRRTKSALCC